MKTIFDKTTREELITRINTLTENNTAQWGKMTVYQVLKHCTLWEEMMQGKTKYPRAFIGRLFGKMALRTVLENDSPLRRNTPTLPELRIKENGDASAQRTQWIARIEEYAHFSNSGLVHPFFGKMTKEQIGYMVYKHIDHHLRQFNA
jgi:hypothetical protein